MATAVGAGTAAGAGAKGARRAEWRRGRGRVAVVLAVVSGGAALWFPLRGLDTLPLSRSELTPLHRSLGELRVVIDRQRGDGTALGWATDAIRACFDGLTTGIQVLISQPSFGRPAPVIGWLGVVAIAALAAYAVAGLRAAGLAALGFGSFGALGLWQESMDTLALTLAAVLVSVAAGVPLGVLIGLSRRAERIATPLLDFMQTMPTFVYLAPLTLFFLIGPASAVIATLVYAIPPVIRVTAHGVRGVPRTSLEAGVSMGATRWQLLRTVTLPMAKRTIVVGVNQTTMCALSMVTIAALIDAPGLGRTIVRALVALDVGVAFRAGLAIVIMAIVLDRVTTAAAVRVELAHRTATPRSLRLRRVLLAALLVLVSVAGYLSYTFVWASTFPGPARRGLVGGAVETAVNRSVAWAQSHLAGLTAATRDLVTYALLNPLETAVSQAPWYLVCLGIVGIVAGVSGLRAAAVSVVCLGLLLGTGLWQDAMATLAATLVATAIVMVIGLVVGVWIGRSARADRLIRPVLDAGQVMPAFVYLVPFLGLFGATRFTAIAAAVVFAAPVAVKLVADGIRTIPLAAVEAAVACGSTPWQVITKVQLPLAARTIALAANQGLLYVLSMVVVGGLVGAGALGYLVVAGFSQTSLYGKGLAAGMAIVLLGVLLDRAAQAAAQRHGGTPRGLD